MNYIIKDELSECLSHDEYETTVYYVYSKNDIEYKNCIAVFRNLIDAKSFIHIL